MVEAENSASATAVGLVSIKFLLMVVLTIINFMFRCVIMTRGQPPLTASIDNLEVNRCGFNYASVRMRKRGIRWCVCVCVCVEGVETKE